MESKASMDKWNIVTASLGKQSLETTFEVYMKIKTQLNSEDIPEQK